MNQALLNRRETDIRRSMAEAVSNYPNSLKQRKIVLRQLKAEETECIRKNGSKGCASIVDP